MAQKLKIKDVDEPFANIALDTINRNKQALIFTSTKAGAESCADKISRHLKDDPNLLEFSQKLLHVLAYPTKQCERLSKSAKKGIVFHHAGLSAKQRELIEDYFRQSKIKIICCTPTLAAGVDLPAFRTVLKDLKRYDGRWGMNWIPVLEYQQMSGRAGRPGKEDFGESLAIASNENDKENIYEKYVIGEVEDIYSKLAVEPVLRIYTLSLIATEIVNSKKQIFDFFKKTFWAYQYKDTHKIEKTITKMISLLGDFGFINSKSSDFVSADEIANEKIEATLLGKRVAQLYVDPLTAHNLLVGMEKSGKKPSPFSMLQLISAQLELRPLLRVKKSDYEKVQEKLLEEEFLMNEPAIYDPFYSEFLDSVKTAMFFGEWIDEKTEEYILEKYNVRPGEIKVKIDSADWLLYAMEELARIIQKNELLKEISKLRLRIKNGVREELIPLLQLKGIGRVRARKLFRHKIKDLKGIKEASITTLSQIIGAKTAALVKEQVGEKVEVVPERKRKGQLSLKDY
ncbi:hypothetical protein KY308_01675 [Candidatus Woesearchaeota archaeon]|nr:hypothetical protein [Candidatus Woesearchaeota archaeon]